MAATGPPRRRAAATAAARSLSASSIVSALIVSIRKISIGGSEIPRSNTHNHVLGHSKSIVSLGKGMHAGIRMWNMSFWRPTVNGLPATWEHGLSKHGSSIAPSKCSQYMYIYIYIYMHHEKPCYSSHVFTSPGLVRRAHPPPRASGARGSAAPSCLVS